MRTSIFKKIMRKTYFKEIKKSTLFTYCRFHAVARTCLTDTVDIHCGSKAANFVYTLMTGQMPPFCDNTNPEYRPVGSDTTRRWNHNDDDAHNTNSADTLPISLFLVLLYFLQTCLDYSFITS